MDWNICGAVSDIPFYDTVAQSQVAERINAAAESASKSKESSRTKQNSLVQATISTLFKKVDKVHTRSSGMGLQVCFWNCWIFCLFTNVDAYLLKR